MAQPPQEEEERLSSLYPDPPPFYKHFTTENLEHLKKLQKPSTSETAHNTSISPQITGSQLLELPAELRTSLQYLVPPEPPAEDSEYHVFGKLTQLRDKDNFDKDVEWIANQLWNKEHNVGVLKDWEYEALYHSPAATSSQWSSINRQNYLFRFLRSILRNYVELLGIMALNPGEMRNGEKTKDMVLKDILTLVLNIHAMVNEYRPHQARETLIGLMESQVERKKAEVEGVRRMAGRVRATLEGFEKDAPKNAIDESADRNFGSSNEDERRRREVQREMWHTMDEILGH